MKHLLRNDNPIRYQISPYLSSWCLVIEIAYAYNVSVHDSCYLALSQIEDKPFIIANYKFVERIKGFKRVIKSAQL
ncbi:MAG: hypothetical protein A2Y62_06330 [Candidatus Fischerbacteria bacterium RBG_13_37_8]|uniref:PIN domain-containing protein n=1 Tax=Candidatus Fischerbacteria bacterium RBG_13_37_8 TaxID=1817863 RepID=A0A1F5VH42_9BACT|nr:MAG: hypothetical protein A2Y62_06330 [Candidatus Fischerbacteria bacterium RBG_13_37_8]